MDAPELERWTRFASKGGIGRCVALQDYLAEKPGDLMFLKVCASFLYSLFHSLKPNRTTKSLS